MGGEMSLVDRIGYILLGGFWLAFFILLELHARTEDVEYQIHETAAKYGDYVRFQEVIEPYVPDICIDLDIWQCLKKRWRLK